MTHFKDICFRRKNDLRCSKRFVTLKFQILLHLPYSRKLELEADEVGLQLIAKVNYPEIGQRDTE